MVGGSLKELIGDRLFRVGISRKYRTQFFWWTYEFRRIVDANGLLVFVILLGVITVVVVYIKGEILEGRSPTQLHHTRREQTTMRKDSAELFMIWRKRGETKSPVPSRMNSSEFPKAGLV